MQVSVEVGSILGQIAEKAEKVAALVEEVAAASREQSRGIEQVNIAVSQMDQVTQANAANSEEAASAAEELSAQAEQMNDMVASLVAIVGGGGAGAAKESAPVHASAPRRHAGALQKPPAVTRLSQHGLPVQAHSHNGNGHTNGNGHSNGHGMPKPDSVIPLDEDEALQEF